jgi:hypothetical protein
VIPAVVGFGVVVEEEEEGDGEGRRGEEVTEKIPN